jgi:hypothetical protein
MRKLCFALLFAFTAQWAIAQSVPFFHPMRFVRTDAPALTIVNSITLTGTGGITINGLSSDSCLTGACAFTLAGSGGGSWTAPTGTGLVTVTGGTLDAASSTISATTAFGAIALQSSTPGTAQTGNLNLSGAGLFGDNLYTGSAKNLGWSTKSKMISATDGVITLTDNAGAAFTRLAFGCNTSSCVSLVSSTTELAVMGGGGGANQSTFTTQGFRWAPVNKTANFTFNAFNTMYTVDATSGAVAATLPAATGTGQVYVIEKTDSSANAVTVTRAGSDTIEGATTYVLAPQYDYVNLKDSASAKWSILSKRRPALAVGTTGQILTSNGTTVDPVWDEPGCSANPGVRYCFFEDFTGADGGAVNSTNGQYSTASESMTNAGTHNETTTRNTTAGQCAGATTVQDTNHPGVNILCSGNATTSSSHLRYAGGTVPAFDISGNGWNNEWLVYPFQLSDGTNTYIFRVGFGDSGITNSSTGAWAQYTHSVNSGAFTLETRSNTGTQSSVNGTCAAPTVGGGASPNGWYKIWLTRASGHWQLYQDGVLCATSTTAEPAATFMAGVVIGIVKSAGTTPASWAYDYFKVWATVAR